MKKILPAAALAFAVLVNSGCNNPKGKTVTDKNIDAKPAAGQRQKNDFSGFLPAGHAIFNAFYGDLNNDGQQDCVLIIKGTDKKNIVKDESRGMADRNRRGIIVLFNKNGSYEQAVKNYDCFSSENEDGGVYFAPELLVEIDKGNLCLHYSHGRYGYWRYTFRFRGADFELIGYDSSADSGAVVDSETSINFLTKEKQVKVNTNEHAQGGDEVFETTRSRIGTKALARLSEIRDFDAFDLSGL